MIIPVGPARNLASQAACSSRVGFPLRSMLGKKNKPSPGKELRRVETIPSSLESRVKPIPLSSTMCETPPQRNMVTPPARVAISHLYRNFIRSSVPCVQDSNLHAALFPICRLTSPSSRIRSLVRWRWAAGLRPTGGWCWRVNGEHAPRSLELYFGNPVHTAPLRRDDEQCAQTTAAEHTSKAPSVNVHSLQDRAAFADAHAALVRYIRVPDSVVGVDADAIWNAPSQVCPDAPIRQAAVATDVERGELLPVGLSDDQCGVVWRHGHPVRKGNAVCNLSNTTIGGHYRDDAMISIDVRVSATVAHEFVPETG